MLTVEVFRHKLVHRLNRCAVDRRQACADMPTGADLKIIELFDRLARDADHLDPVVSIAVERTLADPVKASGLRQVLADLSASVGFSVWPKSATHLVRWMLVQATPLDPVSLASRRARIATGRAGSASEIRAFRAPRRRTPADSGMFRSFACEFTGGLAVVGPMIAVWEIAGGIQQWRDQAFAVFHPATTAMVVTVKTEAATRSLMPPATGTISFRPSPNSGLCITPIRVDTPAGDFAPGHSLTVVPRSATCEVPLIPTQIGDPIASFVCASMFLAAGLAALKAWLWLSKAASRSHPHRTMHPVVMNIAL